MSIFRRLHFDLHRGYEEEDRSRRVRDLEELRRRVAKVEAQVRVLQAAQSHAAQRSVST